MKIIGLTVLTYFLITSCMDSSNNKKYNFREEVDRFKREEIPKKDISLTMFELDTLKETSLKSDIKMRMKYGERIVSIKTEYKVYDQVVTTFDSEEFKDRFFEDQILIDDIKVRCFYVLRDLNDNYEVIELELIENSVSTKNIDPKEDIFTTVVDKMKIER